MKSQIGNKSCGPAIVFDEIGLFELPLELHAFVSAGQDAGIQIEGAKGNSVCYNGFCANDTCAQIACGLPIRPFG